jgi:hypothetical protein
LLLIIIRWLITMLPAVIGLDVPPKNLLEIPKILEGAGSVEDSAKPRPRGPPYYRNNSVNAAYVRRIQRQADKRTASKRGGQNEGRVIRQFICDT